MKKKIKEKMPDGTYINPDVYNYVKDLVDEYANILMSGMLSDYIQNDRKKLDVDHVNAAYVSLWRAKFD
tara:strand:- start:115 stop:321 length:207 start_codon:yes stop_codon:yes gene_type:complete